MRSSRKLPSEVRDAFATEEGKRTPAQRALVEENRRKIASTPEEVRATLTAEHAAALHKIEVQLVTMFTRFKAGPFAPGVHDISREAPKTFLPPRPGKPPEEVQRGPADGARRWAISPSRRSMPSRPDAARRWPNGSRAPQIR